MTTIWRGTDVEAFASACQTHPQLRLAYRIAQVETFIAETFGRPVVCPDMPIEACRVAHLMLETFSDRQSDSERATVEIAALIAAWRARVRTS